MLGLIPRCLGGTLLLNVGYDLTWEALVDSFFTFDTVEYVSVVVITVVITLYGMTEGLVVCAISAAATFVIQSAINSNDVGVIKSIRTARTLRSSRWRAKKILQLLESESTSVTVIQLQGYVFFANAMDIFLKVNHLLEENKRNASVSGMRSPSLLSRRDGASTQPPVMRFLVLDFTLVQSIDSSAAETVAKIHELCATFDVRLCYSRGPTLRNDFRMERLDRLLEGTLSADGCAEVSDESSRVVHVCDSLDCALAWCEDCIIKTHAASLERDLVSEEKTLSSLVRTDAEASRLDKISTTFLNLFSYGEEGRQASQSSDRLFGRSTPLKGPSSVTPKHRRTPSYRPIKPPHMLQLLALCPDEPQKVDKLVSHFRRQEVHAGTFLWQIGDEPDFCVLLSEGGLVASCTDRHFLSAAASIGNDNGEEEDEAILVGHLVGEYSMLMNVTRQGSLRATEDSTVYVLNRGDYLALDDDLKVLLFQVCLNYLGHRGTSPCQRLLHLVLAPAHKTFPFPPQTIQPCTCPIE